MPVNAGWCRLMPVNAGQCRSAYIRLASTLCWSVWFKPSRWQHLNILGTLAKELSKEGSKESVVVISLELSLDKSLAKGPRTLRCCHLDGLNLTDQCKVVACLIYAGQCRSMPVSIYKTCIYLMLVSLIQTIKVTTSQHPWDLDQGVVQGRFQGICSCYFLGTFLGQFLGQGPKNP